MRECRMRARGGERCKGERESRKGTDAWMLERAVICLVKCPQECCGDEENAFGGCQLRCFLRARRGEEMGRARCAGAGDENGPSSGRQLGQGRGQFGRVTLHAAHQNGQGERNRNRANMRQLIETALSLHGDRGTMEKGVLDGLRFPACRTLRMQSAHGGSDNSPRMQRCSARRVRRMAVLRGTR